MLSNPINFHKYFINSRTNKNIIKKNKIFTQQWNRLQSSSLYSIHQQTSFACFTNAYTCIYTKSSWFRVVFRHTRAMQTFMDPCGPQHVYALCGHISLLFFMFFLSYSFPKRLYHPLHHRQSHNRLSPSPQHHVWLHPPIFSCLVNILL